MTCCVLNIFDLQYGMVIATSPTAGNMYRHLSSEIGNRVFSRIGANTMARAKKKPELTIPQKIVNVATVAMPAPLQKILRNRIVSFFFVLLAPLLLATGLATVTWEDGMPKFSVNKEKAAKAKEMTIQKIHEFRDEKLGSTLDARPLSSQLDRFNSQR
jgi:hypothetical protein